MPEGPECRRIADSLRARVVGKSILRIEITEKSRYAKNGLAQVTLLKYPLDIANIWSRGKRIVFECQYILPETQLRHPIWLVSFLGMEGHWQYIPGRHSGLVLSVGHSIYSTPILRVKELSLYFDDARHFGAFTICTSEAELRASFAKIGPDLLADTITLDQYKVVARQKSLFNKEVAWFLMGQKYFSGVGNYLKAEILYASRLYPGRIMNTLTDEDLERLYTSTLNIIHDSYKNGGLTIATYSDANGTVGKYKVKIYNQSMDPQGHPVIKQEFSDKRTTHWVPMLQV
jgi:endonuclease-8